MNKCCKDYISEMKKHFEDGSDKVSVGINTCPFCRSRLEVEIDSKNINPEHNPWVLKSIETLFNHVPDHLHLARNNSAVDSDRYRFYNVAQKSYIKTTSASTVKDCLVKLITILDKEII